jgi:hypothetical protein
VRGSGGVAVNFGRADEGGDGGHFETKMARIGSGVGEI